ncbi:MAG: flavodoxin-dependent (E)-4-hydroxy-3-methylbut-2-enyl-diphosphate synthase [Holosporales bacterium]|jgi:(E)-4-hydroxy-3-methylbut-2-enyl-diphosphate synthase|nr:flavodoxin-dependent (E)-4-hydroxy-3-methylbut-2-enyl-diphosphate synthase [Holosporales bacterium]
MRKQTRQIRVGSIAVGGGTPISIQTMTNSRTENVDATIEQIRLATAAGCDIIRVSCPTPESTLSLRTIVKRSEIPIVADIHFDYKRAMEAIEAGAHCIRINPGTMDGFGVREVVKSARDHGISLRIGVNSGSIERDILEKHGHPTADAIVDSAILSCKKLEDLDFFEFKVSLKSSDVTATITAYRKFSERMNYPLHLGVTEAGSVFSGTIKSSIGIGALIADGIGDTIRVSLSSDILDEVKVGRQILKSLSLLPNSVNVVSCPTCSRTLIDIIKLSAAIEQSCENIPKSIKISILGCVVNGVEEAKQSDIGVFGFREGVAKIYLRGVEYQTITEDKICHVVMDLIDGFCVPSSC